MTTLTSSITLTRAYLSYADGTNLIISGTAGSVGGGGSRSDTYTQNGTFRSYAGGRTRLVTSKANTRVVNFALRYVNAAALASVQSMVGKSCLFRDTYNRRVFGTLIGFTVTDIPLSGGFMDIGLQFTQVSYVEGV